MLKSKTARPGHAEVTEPVLDMLESKAARPGHAGVKEATPGHAAVTAKRKQNVLEEAHEK